MAPRRSGLRGGQWRRGQRRGRCGRARDVRRTDGGDCEELAEHAACWERRLFVEEVASSKKKTSRTPAPRRQELQHPTPSPTIGIATPTPAPPSPSPPPRTIGRMGGDSRVDISVVVVCWKESHKIIFLTACVSISHAAVSQSASQQLRKRTSAGQWARAPTTGPPQLGRAPPLRSGPISPAPRTPRATASPPRPARAGAGSSRQARRVAATRAAGRRAATAGQGRRYRSR